MKILDLVVKHKWYDMEDSGEKPEEYRALSDHLLRAKSHSKTVKFIDFRLVFLG